MSIPTIKAVLFDVIGTTVVEKDPNTITRCFEHAFQNVGLQIDREMVTLNRGRDKKEIISLFITQQKLPAEFTDTIYQSFLQSVENQIENFVAREGAETVFNSLRDHQIKIGLGTGLPRDLFEKIMHHIHWHNNNFDYIGFVEGSIRSRPYPDMIIDFMRRLSLKPNEVLKVGDTVADIQEGRNAGVVTIAMLAGTQSAELLKAEKPDFLIQKLTEIVSIIN